MSDPTVKKILEHPDKDEILSKVLLSIDAKDIHEWLDAKYSSVNEKKFILSEKAIKEFSDKYLDIYSMVQEDLAKVKGASPEDNITLSIQNMPAYKDILIQTVGQELDIRSSLKNLANVIEVRMAQVFDVIQEDPTSINTRVDNTLIKYAEVFGNLLDKYYKFTEVQEQGFTQNNITVNVVDKQITVIHDTIREVLSEMDLETSMHFMDKLSVNLSKMKMSEKDAVQSPSARLAEAKILHETIYQKLDENE